MENRIFLLQTSLIPAAGVGAFTHSHIPQGDKLHHGPGCKTVMRLEHEIPDAYLKFCPLLPNGTYVCPANYLQMGVFWYVNHSDTPNTALRGMRLYAARDIVPGEEITMAYPDLLTHPKNRLWHKPAAAALEL